MIKLIKKIILIVALIFATGIGYHYLSLRQEGKQMTWEEVGKATRNTVDKSKEFKDSAEVKGRQIYAEIEDGYEQQDSIE